MLASCVVGEYIDGALQLLQYLCLACECSPALPIYLEPADFRALNMAGFSALRVYALSNGKYLPAGIVLLLNLVPFGTNMVSSTTIEAQY